MILLDHAAFDEQSINANLGAPEYSYWFVRKAFRPMLDRLGTRQAVTDPHAEAEAIYRAARDRGEPCVLFSFNPPQYVPFDLECPTVPVFAWEYDTIPTEVWDGEATEDWRVPLARCGAAVTHCQSAVRAVRRAMGDDYPIWSIPAPVFSAHRPRGTARGWQTAVRLPADGATVINTTGMDLSLFLPDTIQTLGVRALRMLNRAVSEQRGRDALQLNGVVYTSVFNPDDGRKNWGDLVNGFVWAFRDNPDATLILKITQSDIFAGLMPVLSHLARVGRYRCRIIVIQGMLSQEAYAAMAEATSYVVNTSHGEGQCLPLMEFMSSGRPAIAPTHTAMAEYVSSDNAFPLPSRSRLADWPHDPREARRCHDYEIEFPSLIDAYRRSFRIARDDPAHYRYMSEAASIALENYCSDDIALRRLADVIERMTGHRPRRPVETSLQTPGALCHAAARDRWMAGWYGPKGELYHGFSIGRGDAVVTVAPHEAELPKFVKAVWRTKLNSLPSPMSLNSVRDGSATRVICLLDFDEAHDPADAVSELARVGAPGALYLIAVPSAAAAQLRDAASNTATPPPIAPERLRTLMEGAGLTVLHEDQDGFFGLVHDALAARSAEAAAGWRGVWSRMLAASPDGQLQGMFDRALPGRHIVVAQKPGAAPATVPGPRPNRSWPCDWPVPGADFLEACDPFMQGVRDSVLAGWYNRDTGELAPGFVVSEEDTLLDLGCGGGGFAGFCASRGARMFLADIDPDAAEQARLSIQPRTPHPVETVITPAESLPLPDAMFSRLMCTEVLEHVDDPRRVMDELVRVGRPGARYLLTVPSAAVETIQNAIGPEDYVRKPNHVRVFADGELATLAKESGLLAERTWGDGFFWSVGLFLTWTKGVRPGQRNPTLELWGSAWKALLDSEDGLTIRDALDRLLPKRQIVVARKGDLL